MAQADDPSGTGARLIRLLQAVAEADRDFSLKEMAARTGLPPSTVHRSLQLLVRSDLVERGEGQAYRIGRELFRMAALVADKDDLGPRARPLLETLAQAWGETSVLCLYVPSSRAGVVAEMVRTPHPLQHVIEPFARQPLVWGSLGHAILAHLPPTDVEAALATAEPGPLSGRAPPPQDDLRRRLQDVLRQGWAAYEDPALDIAGVAAPVFGRGGKLVGSLGITMPAARYGPLPKERLCADVKLRARQLSGALGWRPQSKSVTGPG